MSLNCFKAYDIRGRVPDELNETIAYRWGLAFAERFRACRVAVGQDAHDSSRSLLEALVLGLPSQDRTVDMPKLYEYFGIIVMFYANEHEPVHVDGKCQGRECRAELSVLDGVVVTSTAKISPGASRCLFRSCATFRSSSQQRPTRLSRSGLTSLCFTASYKRKRSSGH